MSLRLLLPLLASCSAVGVPFAALTEASAAQVRQIGSIPNSAGKRIDIVGASPDGGRVLVSQGARPAQSLWTLDATTGQAAKLAGPMFGALYSLSADGEWAAWAVVPSRQRCARSVEVARANGSGSPMRLSLPSPFAGSGINAMTVGPGGQLLVRVGQCDFGIASDNQAILSAGPGASSLRIAVRSRADGAVWPVSRSGRAFGMCRRPPGGRRGGMVSVVSVAQVRKVETASTSSNIAEAGHACVVSDGGTATMSVLRRRPGSPGRPRLRDFQRVLLTIGAGRSRRRVLPAGSALPGTNLEVASPDGDRLISQLSAINVRLPGFLIDTKALRPVRRFANPLAARGGATNAITSGADFVDGQPQTPWDPFAPAIVVLASTRGRESLSVRILDPRNLKTGRPTSIATRAGGPPRTPVVCFLPSGRIVVELRSVGKEGTPSTVHLSDPRRAGFTPLDTNRQGAVTSVSCDATTAGTLLLASADSGAIYSASAEGLDGSPPG